MKTAICALALGVLSPTIAWAGRTVVIMPTGTANEHNLEKVKSSIGASVGTVDDLVLVETEVGVDCTLEPSCLASAGRDDGVAKVVGIHLTREGPTFTILFIAVDAATGTELARHEITDIKRTSLEEEAGQALVEFAKSIPDMPAPVEEAPEETVEEVPPEETPVEEVPVEEPVAVVDAPLPGELEEASHSYRVEVGLGTGVLFPQVSSELGTSAGIELDVGVPVWKALSVLGAIGYSQPTVDSSLSDPRLGDAMYSTDTTQRELTMTLGASWRFLKAASRWNAYAGLGGRIWLLETVTNGSSGGIRFGENQETSTRIGAAAWGGAEFLIGPGAAAAELDFGGSDLPHAVTGDVSTTALALQVGYRLRL